MFSQYKFIEKSIFNSIWFHILLERVNRFLDRRISPKKLFGFWIWRIFYTDLIVQRIADLSNILAQIVDLACILDWLKFRQDHCQIGGFCFKFGRIGEFVYPYSPPPPPPLFMSEKIVFVGKMLPLPPPPLKRGTHDAPAPRQWGKILSCLIILSTRGRDHNACGCRELVKLSCEYIAANKSTIFLTWYVIFAAILKFHRKFLLT